MGVVNKGLRLITADNGIRIAFTLFECLSSDEKTTTQTPEHIESSVMKYAVGYTVSAADDLTFFDGDIDFKKRQGWYFNPQLFCDDRTLTWGSTGSADNNYTNCTPLAVVYYTDIDAYGLISILFYRVRTGQSSQEWLNTAIEPPSDGDPGYFVGDITTLYISDGGKINRTGSPKLYALFSGSQPVTPAKSQTITVSWARPGDGKVLTDTYDIDVAPPSATTGGETGGNTGGNTGGGTEEGGGGGHSF